MALKALMLKRKIELKQSELEALRAKSAEFTARSTELERAIGEATTEEEQAAVAAEVERFEADKAANETACTNAETEITEMQTELAGEEERQKEAATQRRSDAEKRKKGSFETMETRERFDLMTFEQRSEICNRGEVKEFLERVRDIGMQKRAVTGGDLLIPDVMLGLIRREVEARAKLLRFVNYKKVKGKGRQNVMGKIPEAVWTEMCASINELDILFSQIEVDGYKNAGFVAICNSVLEDSDIDLAGELIVAIGGAIAKSNDKAMIFGKGVKMPMGIATRLAQTSKPETWSDSRPEWVDLHTTHILKLNIGASSGTEFFESLIGALGVARPVFSTDGLFWAMNRKTHMKIMAKALAFNAGGALVAGMNNVMPIIGGEIVEFEDGEMQDNTIIGGYGSHYLFVERDGMTINRYNETLAIQDQTLFIGKGRYDGDVVDGEAFVIVNFSNTDPETSKDFATDYANTDMNILTVTSAAGTASGDTVLTVSGKVDNDNALAYKKGASVSHIAVGDKVKGFTSLTSGTTQITATAGTPIAVVELDDAGRVISVGSVGAVPKT